MLEVGDFAYAASLIPDEDEMKNTPVRYGQLSDPDGYKIEVREDRKMKEHSRKLFKLTLNVLDIEESVAFYRDVLGMTVLRRRSNVWGIPKHASMCAFMVRKEYSSRNRCGNSSKFIVFIITIYQCEPTYGVHLDVYDIIQFNISF